MNVLNHIAALVDARQRGSEMEIHVRQETMLGIARPHNNRAGIPVLNLDINIGERRIKSARAGVRHRSTAHCADVCRRKRS